MYEDAKRILQRSDPVLKRGRMLIVLHLVRYGRASIRSLRRAIESTQRKLVEELAVLKKAGYIRITRSVRLTGALTFGRITKRGRRALRSHLETMYRLGTLLIASGS